MQERDLSALEISGRRERVLLVILFKTMQSWSLPSFLLTKISSSSWQGGTSGKTIQKGLHEVLLYGFGLIS